MTHFLLQNSIIPSPLLIVPFFQEEDLQKQIPDYLGISSGNLSPIFETKDFEGKFLQTASFYTGESDIPRGLLIGLGKKAEVSVRRWKQVLGVATLFAQSKKIMEISVVIPEGIIQKFGVKETSQISAVSIEVASYSFDKHKEVSSQICPIKSCAFLTRMSSSQKKSFQDGLKSGSLIAESVNWLRELGNTPPSILSPEYFAHSAKEIGKIHPKVQVKILGKSQIEKLKMGCLLGVASGSNHEPKFIIVEYFNGKKNESPTVLVGKGVTFDSGGLSLKPREFLVDMKFDMLGGATVLSTIRAAASLGLKKNVVALVPACENMPSGTAYRPDDILTAMNGRTVSIENTDAEGRLILADALVYAAKYKPKEVIDVATLTGACMMAVGTERSGVFSEVNEIVEKLDIASKEGGEQLWRLPLGEEFMDSIKSEVADVKNLGSSRYGDASNAAAFLQYFTLDTKTGAPLYPWAHIDLSCSYYGGKGKAWIHGGANGFGVETLLNYLQDK